MRDASSRLCQPDGLLEASLLFLLQERPAYGYDLLVRLGWSGLDGSVPGLVYETLRRLRRAGLVAERWRLSTSGRPDRRVYLLTPAGEKALARLVDAATKFRKMLDVFLVRCEKVGYPQKSRAAPQPEHAATPR